MSVRNEQCKKVCQILDDVLANRPSERDALIVVVQKAFDALADDGWIPVEKRPPEEEQAVLICNKSGDIRIASGSYSTEIDGWIWYLDSRRVGPVVAWMPLPKPYESKEDN